MSTLTSPPTPPAHDDRTLTVASVPAGHVYVHHLDPVDLADRRPHRLRDPHPDDPRRDADERWWPPVMLDPAWVAGHDFDLMHLHFGFDARPPAELRELVGALGDRPLVYTVHDLRNPHHPDRATHDAQLDVLVPAAAALITLTPGAAGEIRRRWGREAVVLPHPHVVPLERMARRRSVRRDGELRVGVHLKSLRPSTDAERLLPTLVETVGDLPDAVLQVDVHRDLMDGTAARKAPALVAALRRWERDGLVDLRVHEELDDDALWDALESLDVCVLPYRFGTHSGWLEACRDLGTAVVAPSFGYFVDQGPVETFVHDEVDYDPATLDAAIRTLHATRPDTATTVAGRREQRRQVAEGHDRVYRTVTAR